MTTTQQVPQRIGIGWEVGVPSGWGTYGLNLCLELARRGIEPAIFFASSTLALSAEQKRLLSGALGRQSEWLRKGFVADFPLLHSLADKLTFLPFQRRLTGKPSIGVTFCESAVIPEANVAAAREFALIITGSSWNAEILRRHGLTHVANCPQGVDLDLFHPGPRRGRFGSRFAVFSGGKLEYRKGQDLVVAAFKKFHARHPDTLLVTAWHSPWPELALSFAKSPHVVDAPKIKGGDAGKPVIGEWLAANGIGADAHLDLGSLDHAELGGVLRDMDVALLPSRCEGGTNLVAMECMACGVPTILSSNTGHLDLIGPDRCYALDFQIPMGVVTGRADLEGWGEFAIDEIVAKLELVYDDRTAAAARGAAAAAFMQDWGWPRQVGRLLDAIATVM